MKSDPISADRAFFAALIAADVGALKQLLTDDFILVDVMRGSEVGKPDFLAMIGGGQVKFVSVEPSEVRVRTYGSAAVVTGRTLMQIHAGEDAVTAKSRYTHVYVQTGDAWRMASAQGTAIVE